MAGRNPVIEGQGRLQISKVDPCMGCDNFKICSSEKIACHTMRIWMASNRTVDKYPKVPDKKYYKQIYGNN